MSAVNWLVSQPWPIFLPTFLGPLALLAGLLLLYAHHLRQPPKPSWFRRNPPLVFLHGLLLAVARSPEPEAVWHGHECGCICTDKILPCDAHKGQAAAALHSRQEAP